MNATRNFPIYRPASLTYRESVNYNVGISGCDGTVTVTHVLKGDSILSWLVENEKAFFGVALKYKHNSIRDFSKSSIIQPRNNNELISTHTINLMFDDDLPEMHSYIIVSENIDSSFFPFEKKDFGLNKFWLNKEFAFSAFNRIAYAPVYDFEEDGLGSLIRIIHDEDFDDGSASVEINENAQGVTQPVTAHCGKKIYDSLQSISGMPNENNITSADAFNHSIITFMLSSVYSQLQCNYNADKENYDPGEILTKHMSLVSEKMGIDWKDPGFKPDKAATVFHKLLPAEWKQES